MNLAEQCSQINKMI